MLEGSRRVRSIGCSGSHLICPKHDEGDGLPLAQAGREGSGATKSDVGNDTRQRANAVAILATVGWRNISVEPVIQITPRRTPLFPIDAAPGRYLSIAAINVNDPIEIGATPHQAFSSKFFRFGLRSRM